MHDLIARARVVLTAAVTWLVALAAALTLIAGDLTAAFGNDAAPVVTWIVRVVTWIGVAVLIIRRVTPVLDTARGILPPPSGAPVTARERALAEAWSNQTTGSNFTITGFGQVAGRAPSKPQTAHAEPFPAGPRPKPQTAHGEF